MIGSPLPDIDYTSSGGSRVGVGTESVPPESKNATNHSESLFPAANVQIVLFFEVDL